VRGRSVAAAETIACVVPAAPTAFRSGIDARHERLGHRDLVRTKLRHQLLSATIQTLVITRAKNWFDGRRDPWLFMASGRPFMTDPFAGRYRAQRSSRSSSHERRGERCE